MSLISQNSPTTDKVSCAVTHGDYGRDGSGYNRCCEIRCICCNNSSIKLARMIARQIIESCVRCVEGICATADQIIDSTMTRFVTEMVVLGVWLIITYSVVECVSV